MEEATADEETQTVKQEPGLATPPTDETVPVTPKTEKVKSEIHSDFGARDLFPGFPGFPIRREHRIKKRARCICMENTGITRIAAMLQTLEDKIAAIAVPEVPGLTKKLWATFKYDLSIDEDAFHEKLGTMILEAEEEKIKSSSGKRKRTGNAAKLKEILGIMKFVRTTQNEVGRLVAETTTRYDQLVERQVVVNNKLAHIRVGSGEEPLKMTEWPDWCFLDELPKKKKHKK